METKASDPESGSDAEGKENITEDAINSTAVGNESTDDAYEYDDHVSDEDYMAYEENMPDVDLPFS